MEPPALRRRGPFFGIDFGTGSDRTAVVILGNNQPTPWLRTHHARTRDGEPLVHTQACRNDGSCPLCRMGSPRARLVPVVDGNNVQYMHVSGRRLQEIEREEGGRPNVLTREEVARMARVASAHLDDVRRRLR